MSERQTSAMKLHSDDLQGAMMTKTQADYGRTMLIAIALMLSPATAAANSKSMMPIPMGTIALMKAKGTAPTSPILIRAYKQEAELEVWKQAKNGRFVLLKTFPICRWSGQLGPKTTLGDRQTPEGFYAVGPAQMNPNSSFHLSFDIGYPNTYDRAHGGSGSYLMVHGSCSSAGCFAMTDKGIAEIYALVREAFSGGQQAFQFQSYPFRMTADNMAKHRLNPNIGFWRQLKEGSDRFEATGEEPVAGISAGRYVFQPAQDPQKEALVKARQIETEARVAALVAQGRPAVRVTYADGGQHSSFRTLSRRKSATLGQVSRPDTLALAGQEIILTSSGAPAVKACTPASSLCPAQQSGETKPAAGSAEAKTAASTPSAKVRRTSQAKPTTPPPDTSAAATERPLHEKLLGLFRSEPRQEPASGRKI
jgi:murein L,D-transpeptidase YafK